MPCIALTLKNKQPFLVRHTGNNKSRILCESVTELKRYGECGLWISIYLGCSAGKNCFDHGFELRIARAACYSESAGYRCARGGFRGFRRFR